MSRGRNVSISENVDTTETEELPSKRRKKFNRRHSSYEERSSSDDNDMLDYPCPLTSTPKNQQSSSMKQKLSNSLDNRISCKNISPHHQSQSKSHLGETITADKIELASSTSVENKINDLIKLVIKNNRLVKHQMVYIEQLEKKVDALIKDRGILNRIECQLGEDIKQSTQLFPLKTEDDLNQLESIIKSTHNDSVDENKKKEDIQNQIVRCLSLDDSSNYKESVRRIMTIVMLDQLAVLFSYKGHKGKQKFYEKTISVVIINSVQLCNSKISTEDGLLKKM
ncbi:hypothetical protein FQA39_LY14091 [Lamprigera yunnana]|nr:hypothetical protein FQA39_LY14091 [Lamprigera yunnana]